MIGSTDSVGFHKPGGTQWPNKRSIEHGQSLDRLRVESPDEQRGEEPHEAAPVLALREPRIDQCERAPADEELVADLRDVHACASASLANENQQLNATVMRSPRPWNGSTSCCTHDGNSTSCPGFSRKLLPAVE